VVVQIPYTWGYVDSINRIRRDTGKVVEVVSTWGNQKAISGGMGRVFPNILAHILHGSDWYIKKGGNAPQAPDNERFLSSASL
jgi:hypothetical protein